MNLDRDYSQFQELLFASIVSVNLSKPGFSDVFNISCSKLRFSSGGNLLGNLWGYIGTMTTREMSVYIINCYLIEMYEVRNVYMGDDLRYCKIYSSQRPPV